MTVKQQPHLFQNQPVQHHDSWLAFDPVAGCNGRCVYCFLGTRSWHQLRGTFSQKEAESNPENFIKEAYSHLNDYQFGIRDDRSKLLSKIPISIGNQTDMFHPDHLYYLKFILDLHEKSENRQPIALITKQIINPDFIEEWSRYSFDIYIFFSISFLPKALEPDVPDCNQRIEAAKIVKERIRKNKIKNIRLIHYWRPVTSLMEYELDDIFKRIKPVFSCSMVQGIIVTPEIEESVKSKNKKLYDYILKNKQDRNNIVFKPSVSELQAKAKEHQYPVFKHTSCALSFIQKKSDYNGTMWRTDCCEDCVPRQKVKCEAFKRKWKWENYQSILNESHHPFILHDDCLEITRSISQEEANYLTHLTGKPVFSKAAYHLMWPSSNQIYFLNKYVNE